MDKSVFEEVDGDPRAYLVLPNSKEIEMKNKGFFFALFAWYSQTINNGN